MEQSEISQATDDVKATLTLGFSRSIREKW